MQSLINWKAQKNRKPLLLYGARQVGKTHLIKEFGEKHFEDYVYVNFETNNIMSEIIEENIEPKNIIKELEVAFGKKINKEKTLIIFDEIQANPRALTSLKYFNENQPDYYIIAAGSLLGVHIKRKKYSFPVGKVDTLTIYPMDFEEFLIATGNELLCEAIKEAFNMNFKMSNAMHEKAMNLYNDYLAIGGMPEVVLEYIREDSLISAIDIQANIISDYKNDITKYADTSSDANKILATFDSIPNQLVKDNKKFQYKVVQKGGTSSIFGDSINWLINAGIINQCYKTKIGVPLSLYKELESFKLYMSDIGLLTKMSDFPIYLIKNREAINETMIGTLTENYVASCLKYNNLELYYWKNEYDSEVDFILQNDKGDIIPVEVKSKKGKARSLANYIKEYKPKYAIKIGAKNFGFVNNIKTIPLYAAFCITKVSLNKIGEIKCGK